MIDPYKHFVRPLLFSQPSERVHDQTISMLAKASGSRVCLDAMRSFYGAPEMPVELFGLRFPNPLGLAAGMDKQAVAVPIWEAMGFGFCELGGVTWHPQPGNPQPRMFRAVKDEAVVNRMGFNNSGAEAMAETLREWKSSGLWPKHPVGVNLGKSKITPLEEAADDYLSSFRLLRDLADFFVINVSSPNTPNLRKLQDKAALDEILAAVQDENHSGERSKPVLVKVAPDLTFEALDEIIALVQERNIDGIVATNTTITRPPTVHAACRKTYDETGGLSGKPLRDRSTEVIRHIYSQSEGRIPIIGVGGIFNAADAWEKIAAGATLLQIYTGLIYEGPGIVRAIVEGLLEKMNKQGIACYQEIVGTELNRT